MDNIINSQSMNYYNDNYYPIFAFIQNETKGGYEVADILNGITKSKTYYVCDSCNKCRFCGKVAPEVSFKEKTHLFPESLGNKLFVSKNNECDTCNRIFSNYEADLNTFLYPYLVLNRINGKNGIKKYRSNDKSSRIEYTGNIIKITDTLGKTKIQECEEKKELQYEFNINSYSLSKVYRIMLKMALSMLQENEFEKFTIAKDSLVNKYLLGCEFLLFDFFPGFNRFEFSVIGYEKKVNDSSIPTYQFAIMNGNFLLQIPIFSDEDIRNNVGKTININPLTIPTPFDKHDFFGEKEQHVFKIKDNSVSPTSTVTITLKYDSKTKAE